jgi:biotin synthase
MTTLASLASIAPIDVSRLRRTPAPSRAHGNAVVNAPSAPLRWAVADVAALYALPFMDLLFQAQQVHRAHFDANEVQLSTLLSIKTGGCAEDCGYCPQAASADSGVEATKLMPLGEVMAAAQAAKDQGATRFCMGAAWRSPKARDMDRVTEMVSAVRSLGLQTCMTLGMLLSGQKLRRQKCHVLSLGIWISCLLTY